MRSPELAAGRSPAAVLKAASQRLSDAGCDTPRLDAELLLAAALGVRRERLLIESDGVGPAELAQFDALLGRRERREPVAYILGHKGFRGITVNVDRRVLIPRPESELLVEVGRSLEPGARVVDVGTGSGAVALALKDEHPELDVWASDVSHDALDVARANARRLGLDVRFVRADLLEGVGGRWDAVVANPPYVELGAQLQPEITEYEPAGALFAGVDGLDVIRRLVPMLAAVPLVALEVGAGQAPVVTELLHGVGFGSVEALRDLGGHERVVVGTR